MKNLNQIVTQHAFNFHNGRAAHSVEELQKLCQELPEAAGWHLQSGHFDTWLSDNGRADLARSARYARNTFSNAQAALRYFIRECTIGTYLIREDAQLSANIRREWWSNGRILAYSCTDARNLSVIGADFSTIGRAWHPSFYLLVALDYAAIPTASTLLVAAEVVTNPLIMAQGLHHTGKEPYKRCVKQATIERDTLLNRTGNWLDKLKGAIFSDPHDRTFQSHQDAIHWLMAADEQPCDLSLAWPYRY